MTMVRSCKLDGTKRRGALERRVADFEKHRFKRKYAVHRKDANPITAKRPKHDGDGRWITFEKAKAIAFYGKGLGLNVRQAAKHHGVSVDTISRTFRRMGSLVLTLMSVAVDAFWPRPAHDELEEEPIVDLVAESFLWDEAAQAGKVKYNRIDIHAIQPPPPDAVPANGGVAVDAEEVALVGAGVAGGAEVKVKQR